jgi:hypothetical protein
VFLPAEVTDGVVVAWRCHRDKQASGIIMGDKQASGIIMGHHQSIAK